MTGAFCVEMSVLGLVEPIWASGCDVHLTLSLGCCELSPLPAGDRLCVWEGQEPECPLAEILTPLLYEGTSPPVAHSHWETRKPGRFLICLPALCPASVFQLE